MCQTRFLRDFLFQILKSFSMFLSPIPIIIILSQCLKMSACAERFSRIVDEYLFALKKNMLFFYVFFSSFVASSLSCNGMMLFWPVLCLIHSVSVLNSTDLFLLIL